MTLAPVMTPCFSTSIKLPFKNKYTLNISHKTRQHLARHGFNAYFGWSSSVVKGIHFDDSPENSLSAFLQGWVGQSYNVCDEQNVTKESTQMHNVNCWVWKTFF